MVCARVLSVIVVVVGSVMCSFLRGADAFLPGAPRVTTSSCKKFHIANKFSSRPYIRSQAALSVMTSTAPPQPERSEICGGDFDNWFWGDAHVKGGVEHAVFEKTDSAVVLFDGECNFCNSGVWMMISNSDERNMRFCAQNTEMGLSLLHSFGQDAERLSSIAVLDKDGHLHTRSDAVVEILSRMQMPYPALGVVLGALPTPVRDAMYSWVSRRRHAFGTETQLCRVPEDEECKRFLL